MKSLKMGRMLFGVLAMALLAVSSGAVEKRSESYMKDLEGQQVLSVTPSTEAQLKTLHDLGAVFDFWVDPSGVGHEVGIRVPIHDLESTKATLAAAGMTATVAVEDVAALVQEQDDSNQLTGFSASNVVGRFARIDDIHAWLEDMAKKHSDKAAVFSSGKSYQGRPLKGLKIGRNANAPAIWFHAGIHAREWAAPASCIYIINLLLTSTDPSVTRLVDGLVWYIIPVLNPDGYEFTHTNNRMWRKTLQPHNYFCPGADPNRNWDAHFGTTGVSSNPCTDIYPGPHAFSEPEVKSTAQTIMSLRHSLKAYISFHAFSQLWLMPWGYTTKKCDDYDDLYKLAYDATQKVQARHNTRWRVGPPSHILYAASGGSFDWVKETAGIKYAYALELRPDRMNPGFLLPANQIIPSGEESWEGVKYVAEFVLKTYG